MGLLQQKHAHIIAYDYGFCPRPTTKFEQFWIEEYTNVQRFGDRKYKTNIKIKFNSDELVEDP